MSQKSKLVLPNPKMYNDHELLLKVAGGDQQAFEQLFNMLYPRLVIFTETFTYDRSEAEDIVSESFLKLWQVRDRFEAINPLKSFLYITSRNAALNGLRSRKNQVKTPLTGEEVFSSNDSDETEILRAEIIGTLFHEIEQMPLKYREVMLLTYRESLSSRQISERLGITISNVTTLRSRAIRQLKLKLRQHYPALLPLCAGELLHQLLTRP